MNAGWCRDRVRRRSDAFAERSRWPLLPDHPSHRLPLLRCGDEFLRPRFPDPARLGASALPVPRSADRSRARGQFDQPRRVRQPQLVFPCDAAARHVECDQHVGGRGGSATPALYGTGSALAPWEIARPVGADGALATEFTLDLQQPEITDAVRDYAAPSFAPGRPLIDVLTDLNARIFDDFTYRSGSTTVSTQVNEVLAAREGVCQDFARLAIACLRANGLAASYISGYLATDPPPGKERMVGVDATHAWAAVWTPQNQWLGLDPTNDQMVDERYIIVGWGRDYADVPPLRGIIYTDSERSVIDVSVDVAPFDPAGGVLQNA